MVEKVGLESYEPELLEKLSELCGIILGDGNLHKSANRITITGSLDDKKYYEETVIPLFQTCFSKTPKMKRAKEKNSYYLYVENKKIFQIFIGDLGLKRGSKLDASVPSWIYNFNCEASCLRGLFDTDGCLKFSKQAKNYHYYPRIRLCFRDSPLVNDIRNLLQITGFNFSSWPDRRYSTTYYEISGNKNLEKWFKTVGMHNPVHRSKYLLWKKTEKGFPRSVLSERLKMINSTTYFRNTSL